MNDSMPKRTNNDGPTLADVCRLAASRGVIITVCVLPEDVGRMPQRISVGVKTHVKTDEPRAFQLDLLDTNLRLNRDLGVALGEYVDKVKPRKGKIIQL